MTNIISGIKQTLIHNLLHIPGWRTNRKIVLIESDDWGSIRMPSNEIYQKLLLAGINVNDPYSRFDSLASEDDLSELFNLLRKHKDKNGKNPVITANTVVANPDFEKIKNSGFTSYSYEPFTETLTKYPKHAKSFTIWKEGINEGVWMPQFHAREHINVKMWLDDLKKGDKNFIEAFKHGVFAIPVNNTKNPRQNYMASFDYFDSSHLNSINESINEGLELFSKIFGYNSQTMIAPCYHWTHEIEKQALQSGIKGFQGIRKQYSPDGKSKVRFIGKKNKLGQYYLVRNASFEPSHFPTLNHTSDIIDRMRISFFWHKPLIISTHRLNFIGFLNEENRKTNLKKLDNLLIAMLKEFPDIEFMSSPELLKLISNKTN